MRIIETLIAKARSKEMTIALCEATDKRVLRAAKQITEEQIARIILVGPYEEIVDSAKRANVSLDGMRIFDPQTSQLRHSYANVLYELRKAKGMHKEDAEKQVQDPLIFASLLVKQGVADGMVSGAVYTTSDVVRSAIQIIGKKPGYSAVSSFFLMLFCKQFHQTKTAMIFSDCALVIDPDAKTLAEIALSASESGRIFLDNEPRVAMLSFSTNGSAKHAAVDKVTKATQLAREQQPNLIIDGDIQLDAALIAEISEKKYPDSRTKGMANVLIFPNLEAGNIGYKLAERLGQATAIGPLLQGLAKPANDLSRGCSIEDIVYVVAATAIQAQAAST
ncbi:phosphate acetyltransferase [Veronia nyctiphanis]|uniref:Phosphate acetyltransferase n=1 Tax=Veronia nyctiphanis TaxID=1278244 RepID=A0A4Q0YEZ7_9GAMM|nr:phosphate acetyltransferase [Veronia nyctiphanis]RXJ69097.1 phosphate acetyltransferase [Veronia nyctiphanis]